MTRLAISPVGSAVEVIIDGELVRAYEGEPLAAVFFRLENIHTKTMAETGNPRAPYCMMGACFECLVHVDGVGMVRSCQETVQAGMRIERQQGLRQLR